MISVIIPSYRNPAYLDLCLKSAFENQVDENEILVVLDGFAEESRHVIDKYPNVGTIPFDTNKGQMVAHNTGVTLASGEYILIVNDDNVFPRRWDFDLNRIKSPTEAFSPNQIEPSPSIFSSFVINDLGRTPEEFRYEEFLTFADGLKLPWGTPHWHKAMTSVDGSTWPLFMHKKWFMAVGGFDVSFPSPAVADHDLFLRLQLAGITCLRYRGAPFYHFAGAATKRNPEQAQQHAIKEAESHEYFQYKWGFPSIRNEDNLHNVSKQLIRGIQF